MATSVHNFQMTTLSRKVLQAFDNANGYHPGFRPAQAKGILLSGLFRPAASGGKLTRAPHLHQPSTPVLVRFSSFAGIPNIPDNDPAASPRGIAIRFHLGEHAHTDLTAHSVDGFPARTAEDFIDFLNAAAGPSAAFDAFLSSHPAALTFVQTPKPFPRSFSTESFFGVNAYLFSNLNGVQQFGRYKVSPEILGAYLNQVGAAAQSPDYLEEEIKTRLNGGPVTIRIAVQLSAPGDIMNDSTVRWPADRPLVEFGRVELQSVVPYNDVTQRQIVFDPISRIDGIDPSDDPLLAQRADVYRASGCRRGAATD